MADRVQSDSPLGSIVVTGDPTVDWMLVVDRAPGSDGLSLQYQWDVLAPVEMSAAAGGAAMLGDLVAATATATEPSPPVHGMTLPEAALCEPHFPGVSRTYSTWQPVPARPGSRDTALRLSRYMGRHRSDVSAPMPLPHIDVPIACLVIDESNLGVRDRALPDLKSGLGSVPHHIILRCPHPMATGPMWDSLIEHHADRLTLYIGAGELRKEHAPVGQPLSWERSASEVVNALALRPDLSRAARIVVLFGTSGAVLIEPGQQATLIYDPFHQESDWERSREGVPYGIAPCMMASLATAFAVDPANPDVRAAIASGLHAARIGFELGIEPDTDDGPTRYRLPVEKIGAAIRGGDAAGVFQFAPIPDYDEWRLFANAFSGGYLDAAIEIATEGDRVACRALPVERMGAWASVDRVEIESMRSVRNIVGEYLAQPRRGRPLNLAVFGPPGSGKSFAIKQMAKQWAGGPIKLGVLEFNVSQFARPEDLPAALQRVRDLAVEETIPLVFWDEFDTQFGGRELGWLAQFLAPMQDGTFLEAGVVRPIGPAIFIFAGGTHATMSSFKSRAVEIPGAKATDFLSRLRGFVDVLGPNPSDESDETFVLRRALLLRAVLHGKAPRLFDGDRLSIDPAVLRAFLDVDRYLHGSRSLESIVDMSSLAGNLRYERSALPAAHQLALHVDPVSFLGIVHDTER